MSAANTIVAYGYDLGDVRNLGLSWATDPQEFGEEATARLADAMPTQPVAPLLDRVDLVAHGFEEKPHWLLVTEHRSCPIETTLDLTALVGRQNPGDDSALMAALKVLGLSAERPPSWIACTYQ